MQSFPARSPEGLDSSILIWGSLLLAGEVWSVDDWVRFVPEQCF